MKNFDAHSFVVPGEIRCWLSILILTVVLLTSTAQAADLLDDASYEDEGVYTVSDPIEPVNRAIFVFNDKLYLWVLDPVATGYSKVVPRDIRGCIGNFFYNLSEPVRAGNCLLQGRFRDSGLTISRFLLNSIFGVFGLADPASHEFAIAPVYATFGETLSVWGIGDGFYLVVPLYGPSTLRDFTGFVVDSVAETTYYPWDDDDNLLPYGLLAVEFLNKTSLHLGEYQELKSLSFDPYIALRNGYFQMRSKQRNHRKPSPTNN
nr:VacJ family lipoprotein [uncultured Desulfobulbus sp.]